MSGAHGPQRADVVVVGGGPVGLLLACRLGQLGLSCQVLEQRQGPVGHSRAIGIHPPSLELLDQLELTPSFVERGVKVTAGEAVGSRRVLGRLTFDQLPGPHRYALSLPQDITESLLQQRLQRLAPGSLRQGVTVTGVAQDADGVSVHARGPHGASRMVRCRHVVGCDGKQSLVRQAAEIPFEGAPYDDAFVMGDFADNTPFGTHCARIYITRQGLVESFPLPGKLRRWVASTASYQQQPTLAGFCELVRQRTGHELQGQACAMLSPFGIQRFLAQRFVAGRLTLAGDSAHVMSPLGGQGMNTGWLNAWDLASALARGLQPGAALDRELAAWERLARRRGANAIRRASLNTGLGRLARLSALRNAMVWLLLHSPVQRSMARVFTMRGL